MNKLKNLSLASIFLFFGCVQNSSTPSVLSPRWVSENNSKFQIWFQNWSGYTRLFITINEDTSIIQPSQYATSVKGKPHLFPKSKSQIKKVQLIGNIIWIDEPAWLTGKENKFIWKVDRSNPKIELPSEFEGSAMIDKNIMKLTISKNNQVIYDLALKPISV
tara:strand:- start:2903 stop:3388 length:486 start_codon:yes stop_codon:yes gene_type:complete